MSLETIISSFSDENANKFLMYLQKKNRRSDVKNSTLFKLIYTQKFTSKEIKNQLYKADTNNDAYHALRKRLHQTIIDFLAAINLEEENSDKTTVIKYILVARSFLQQNHYNVGSKLLDKAHKIADNSQLYPYLNEIYRLRIQYAHLNPKEDLEKLIDQFNKNQNLLKLEEQLNIVYAKVKAILYKISNKGEVIDFQKIVLKILHEQHIDINKNLSFKSFYQLLSIVSISAFISKDYLQIESFMLNTYDILRKHPNKDKERFYHIHVLYMIANTLFRTKQFKKSMYFLGLMNNEIDKNPKKYEAVFKLKYELLYNLNLNYTNNQDIAINRLENLLVKKRKDYETTLDLFLALIVFLFQKGAVKKSYKLITELYHTDSWYEEKVGNEWVIKKNLIEILLLVELDYSDLFDNRLAKFKRQHGAFLKTIGQEQVLIFLKYVELFFYNPKTVTTIDFYNKVEKSFRWIGAKEEDIFVMSFYAWLKSKMIQKPIYETTLALVKQAQDL